MQFFIYGPSKRISKAEEDWVSFDDIRLEGGFAPSIRKEVADVTGLEPALWFKVLLVDAIAIDIDSALLYWTTCKRENCNQRKMSIKPYTPCCHSQECYLRRDHISVELDMCQGLEIAENILKDKTDRELDLLRLLHVYVLPQIKFTRDDDVLFNQALEKQQKILQDLDGQLDVLSEERKNIKATLRLWRRDICSTLQNEDDFLKCNIQFLKILCSHLEMDLKASYAEIEMYSDQIEEIKRRVEFRKKTDELQVLLQALENLRQERNKVAEHLDAALYVHEEVKLLEDLTLLRGNLELTDSQKGYIKTQEMWKKYCKEIMEIHKKKVCAVSVREALINTRQEITEIGETSGPDAAADGTGYSTDIHVTGQLPIEWQSLQNQIARVVETNSEISELHNNFCTKVNRMIREEMKGQPSVGKIKRSIRLPKSFKALSDEDRVCMLRQSLRERKPTSHFQAVAQQLQQELLQHFGKISTLLVQEKDAPSMCYSQLWVCYERCFFPDKFSDILKLYVYAYGDEIKRLKKKLPDLTPSDLDMDDEWLLNILGLYSPSIKIEEIDLNSNSNDKPDARERLESGIVINEQKRDRRLRRFTAIIDGNYLGQPIGPDLFKRSSIIDIDPSIDDRKPRSSTYTAFPLDEGNLLRVPLESKLTRRHTSPLKRRNRTTSIIDSILSTDLVSGVGGINDSGIHTDHISPAMEASESIDETDSSSTLKIQKEKDRIEKKKKLADDAVQEFQERFAVAYKSFEEVVDASVPMTKMQWLYRCLQQVNGIAQKQAETLFCGKRSMLSGDDLLTALILFLINGNPGIITAFYPQLQFLLEYLPNFLSKGQFGFTITQFYLAFTYILQPQSDSCRL